MADLDICRLLDEKLNVTSLCRAEYNTACSAQSNDELWAKVMFNSNGREESGKYHGNLVYLGDYNQCVDRRLMGNSAIGNKLKFCSAFWMEEPFRAGHGLCLPDSCTSHDFLEILQSEYDRPSETITMIDYYHCVEEKDFTFDWSAVLSILVAAFVVLVVLVTSALDAFTTLKKQRGRGIQALFAFSLLQNVPQLFNTHHARGSYECLHGIRVWSMVWMVLGHTYLIPKLTVFFLVENHVQYNIWHKMFTLQFIRHVGLAVDSFLVLSAFLATVSFMREWQLTLDIDSRCETVTYYIKKYILYVLHRYCRLTPVYAFMLMLYTNVRYYVVNGPLFPDKSDDEPCKHLWTSNLLYFNNDATRWSCLPIAWYLGLDFQCYMLLPVFAGPLLWVEYKRKNQQTGRNCSTYLAYAWLALPVLGCVAFRVVIYPTFKNMLPHMWQHSDAYLTTPGRGGIYFMAVYLGYFVYKTDRKIYIQKVVVTLGWLLAAVFVILPVYFSYLIPDDCRTTCSPLTLSGIRLFYVGLYRPLFALGVMWIVFACVTGNGGFVNSILSARFWLPLSKLSYVVYLVHACVITTFIFASPAQHYIYHWTMVYQFIGHLSVSLGTALILWVFVEMPFSSLEKILTNRKSKTA